MKAKELKEFTNKELEQKEADLREELFKLRLQLATTRQLENVMRIRQIKRDIARVLTVYRERLVNQENEDSGRVR